MQRDENLLHINNGQQIDAIHMGYHQTKVVYTHWSGLLDIHPDRTPIRSRIWIGSNSNIEIMNSVIAFEQANFLTVSQWLVTDNLVYMPFVYGCSCKPDLSVPQLTDRQQEGAEKMRLQLSKHAIIKGQYFWIQDSQ